MGDEATDQPTPVPRRPVPVQRLLAALGTTYAEDAGLDLRDEPPELYRLLVLATLLSARISSETAVRGARELADAGYGTPRAMLAASWQDRVDALGRGGYRRYDESTARMLGRGARLLLDDYGGDLRRLRDEAGSVAGLERELQRFPGIGPTGAAIFCREVQGVWPDVAPYVDARAAAGAALVGLPTTPDGLAALVAGPDLPRLVAACVRVALHPAAAAQLLD